MYLPLFNFLLHEKTVVVDTKNICQSNSMTKVFTIAKTNIFILVLSLLQPGSGTLKIYLLFPQQLLKWYFKKAMDKQIKREKLDKLSKVPFTFTVSFMLCLGSPSVFCFI